MIKMHKERLVLSLSIFLIIFFLFSMANAQKAVSEEGKYGGTLTVGIRTDFKSLDSCYFGLTWLALQGEQHFYN